MLTVIIINLIGFQREYAVPEHIHIAIEWNTRCDHLQMCKSRHTNITTKVQPQSKGVTTFHWNRCSWMFSLTKTSLSLTHTHTHTHFNHTSPHMFLSGNIQPQSSQPTEPLWADPGIKSGISGVQLISTLKKKKERYILNEIKKRRPGMNGRTFSKNPCRRGVGHHQVLSTAQNPFSLTNHPLY